MFRIVASGIAGVSIILVSRKSEAVSLRYVLIKGWAGLGNMVAAVVF